MDARTAERTDRIYLDPSIARCEPGQHCGLRAHCARYMAALPPAGASMMDGTASAGWSPSYCPQYISAASCTNAAPAKPPAPKRRHWDCSEW